MATKKPTRKKADIEIGETVKKKLMVQINEKACDKKRSRIVEALTERIIQQEKAKPFRDRAKALTEEVEKLRSEIKSSQEERDVPCVMEFNYKAKEVQFRRADTKTIVKELSRAMTVEEATGDLFAAPKKTKRAKAEKAPEPGTPAEQLAAEAAAAEHATHYDPAEGAEEANA